MKAIIIGAGELGYHLAQLLSEDEHQVAVIDIDDEARNKCSDHLDVITYRGNGVSKTVLEDAEIEEAEMLFAVTDSDEVNMAACLVARNYKGLKTVARIRNQEYIGDEAVVLGDFIGIDYAVNPDSATAMEIARLVQMPGTCACADFANGRIRMLEIAIEKDIRGVTGVPLKDTHWRENLCVIAAIIRDEKIVMPHGKDQIMVGDRIFVLFPHDKLKKIKKLFDISALGSPERVAIFGARQICYFLSKILIKAGIGVTIIDNDKELCREMADLLPEAMVILGDGSDIDLLKEERILNVDAVLALTRDDKLNILVSVIAKHYGVERVVTRISRADYAPLLHKMGIDLAVSPLMYTASAIYNLVQRYELEGITSATLFEEGEAEILEFTVKSGLPFLNKPFTSIYFPAEAIIGAIIRGERIIFPGGEDHLLAGDRIIVFLHYESKDEIVDMFDLE